MGWLGEIYAAHPFWVWLSIGAVFLAAEVSTGTGYLLWPTGAAVLVALLTLVMAPNLPVEVTVFAVVTAVSALFGRRFLPKNFGSGPDINDNFGRLVGKLGSAVSTFENGKGRVFIDGKEWAATTDDAESPALGQRVKVLAAEGSVLQVTAT